MKERDQMGGVNLKGQENIKKTDWTMKPQFGHNEILKGTTPPTNLNGNGNWGRTGDELEIGGKKGAPAPDSKKTSVTPTGNPPVNSGSNTETVSEIDQGNAALTSNDKGVVSTAAGVVGAVAANADTTAPVAGALSTADAAQAGADGAKGVEVSATTGQKEADGVKKGADADKTQKAETAQAQAQDLIAKEAGLKKAESAVLTATGVRDGAKTASEAADAAATAAAGTPAAIPAKAAAAAAKAKLATAEASLKVAEAEKKVAEAERDASKAKKEQDDVALKEAEAKLKTANTELTKANTELSKAKKDYQEKKAVSDTARQSYEKIKDDTTKVSADLKEKLDDVYKKLDEGEKNDGAAGATKMSGLEKATSIAQMGQQGLGLANMFMQNGNSGSASSSKRKMTTEESAELDKTLSNVGNFIQKGGAEITHTGESVMSANSKQTAQAPTNTTPTPSPSSGEQTNPFKLKLA